MMPLTVAVPVRPGISMSIEIIHFVCLAIPYIVGFCVHCGLSYIPQNLSELGTASNLKTVSGFLGCGQSVYVSCSLSLCVIHFIYYYLVLIELTS